MLIIISPAKSLDFENPPVCSEFSTAVLLKESPLLIKELQKLTPSALSKLMNISEKLSNLNTERNLNWSLPFSPKNAKQALLAFRGDVYTGIDADTFSPKDFKTAQKQLRILSGLYGLLRPLDLIQPYRLEMGTKLSNERGKNLYEFWGSKITDELNISLSEIKSKVLINLASNEYFKAVKKKELNAQIITPIFKDNKNGTYKVISFYAKKARGMMTRFILQNNLKNYNDIKAFNSGGYIYSQDMSSGNDMVFIR